MNLKHRLVVFDMDGTLIPHSTALLEIAKIKGHTKQLELLEKQYTEKLLDNGQFAEAIHSLWQDLSHQTVKEAFDKAPKLKNIHAVLTLIAKQGGISCLITAAPDFFANHFKDFGFDYILASQPFNLEDRIFKADQVLHGRDKPILVQKLCQQLNLFFAETLAFGDSLSDVPLFEKLYHTVAINGDTAIDALAKYRYKGFDLLEAFQQSFLTN